MKILPIILLTVAAGCTHINTGSENCDHAAVIDPVRVILEQQINQTLTIAVKHLEVEGDCAFLIGIPKTASGATINYSNTRLADIAKNSDGFAAALLKRVNGRWTSVQTELFYTDMWWANMWEQHEGCPRSIFP